MFVRTLRTLHPLRHPLVKKIGVGVLDTLFPIQCLGCGANGEPLCQNCLALFPWQLRQRCPSCYQATTPRGEVCFACSGTKALDGLFAASHYRHPLIAHAVHTYKYRFIPSLAKPLGLWLSDRLAASGLTLPHYYIPVPLHKRRLRFRGFNQAALIADVLADTLTPGNAIPVLHNCLLRTRATRSQIKTRSRLERLENLKNAFALAPENAALLSGKTIWLVDDIATTGTTLEECARILKAGGAKSVFGIVLAR